MCIVWPWLCQLRYHYDLLFTQIVDSKNNKRRINFIINFIRYDENDLIIYHDISTTLEYRVKNHDKTVVYWLAELRDVTKPPTLSEEHEDLKWLVKDDAKRLGGYSDFADMLEEFHTQYLSRHFKPTEVISTDQP